MSETKIQWKEDKMVTIHYTSMNKHSLKEECFKYDVIYVKEIIGVESIFVFVRSNDAKYGVLELRNNEVRTIIASGYDDCYFAGCETTYQLDSLYEGVERYYQQYGDSFQEEASLIYSDDEPLCLVNKGVNNLLSCTPVLFNNYNTDGVFWNLGVPFLCKSFSKDYIFINGCTLRHNIRTGELGKAWYKEKHHLVQYNDGGYNQWACYMYAYKENCTLGAKKWKVVDENNPSHYYDDIEADDIIMADLWSSVCDVIAVSLGGTNYLYFFRKKPIREDRIIECNDWLVTETKKGLLYFILTSRGMMVYSENSGLLSEKKYFPFSPKKEMDAEQFVLSYYNSNMEICKDVLSVDANGVAQIIPG